MIGIVPGLGKEDVVQGISTPGSPVGCAGSSPAGGRRLGQRGRAWGGELGCPRALSVGRSCGAAEILP